MENRVLFKAKCWIISYYDRERLTNPDSAEGWSCSVMWRLLIGCYRHSDWRIKESPAARCYPSGSTWTEAPRAAVCIYWSALPKTGAAPNTRRDFLLTGLCLHHEPSFHVLNLCLFPLQLKENIEKFFTWFVEEGKATVRLKEPAIDICLSKVKMRFHFCWRKSWAVIVVMTRQCF